MKKREPKIIIKDLESFFIDDILNQVEQRKELKKEQKQEKDFKNKKLKNI